MPLLIITYAIIVVFTISFAFLSFVWPVLAFLGRLAFIIGAVCSAFWAIVFGALFVVLSRRGFFDQFRDDPVTWDHTGARVLRVVLINMRRRVRGGARLLARGGALPFGF